MSDPVLAAAQVQLQLGAMAPGLPNPILG